MARNAGVNLGLNWVGDHHLQTLIQPSHLVEMVISPYRLGHRLRLILGSWGMLKIEVSPILIRPQEPSRLRMIQTFSVAFPLGRTLLAKTWPTHSSWKLLLLMAMKSAHAQLLSATHLLTFLCQKPSPLVLARTLTLSGRRYCPITTDCIK